MSALKDRPIGQAHATATCCWCKAPLVVAQVMQLRCWVCPIDWRRQVQHALIVTAAHKDHAKLMGVTVGTKVCLDVPLPSQVQIEDATAKNILWGGQAGPGKSHGVRKFLYRRSLAVPGHLSLLLRENWDQLDKTHIRNMQAELPLLGARMADRTAIFPNGSFIDCGHMADADSVSRYLSTEYGCIVPEEASLYPVNSEGISPLAELSTRARIDGTDTQGRIVPAKFVPVTNPGGPSHSWLMDLFVDHTPDFDTFPALRETYRAEDWLYIPARLDDNPYMRESYKHDLSVLSKYRYEQLRHGDWHVFAGQFFGKWQERQHVVDRDVPSGVQWFTAIDWGSLSPGCVLWFAVLPDRRLYLRAELKFQGQDVAEVSALIKQKEKELGITGKVGYRVGDPAMWIKDAKTKGHHLIGESIADTFRLNGIALRQADHDRVNGWARCLQLLRPIDKTNEHSEPWFTVHSSCRYFIRTIAAARSDKHNPEDVDSSGDDHALDTWRYAVMSRPSPLASSHHSAHPKGSIGWLRKTFKAKPGLLTRGRHAA